MSVKAYLKDQVAKGLDTFAVSLKDNATNAIMAAPKALANKGYEIVADIAKSEMEGYKTMLTIEEEKYKHAESKKYVRIGQNIIKVGKIAVIGGVIFSIANVVTSSIIFLTLGLMSLATISAVTEYVASEKEIKLEKDMSKTSELPKIEAPKTAKIEYKKETAKKGFAALLEDSKEHKGVVHAVGFKVEKSYRKQIENTKQVSIGLDSID